MGQREWKCLQALEQKILCSPGQICECHVCLDRQSSWWPLFTACHQPTRPGQRGDTFPKIDWGESLSQPMRCILWKQPRRPRANRKSKRIYPTWGGAEAEEQPADVTVVLLTSGTGLLCVFHRDLLSSLDLRCPFSDGRIFRVLWTFHIHYSSHMLMWGTPIQLNQLLFRIGS